MKLFAAIIGIVIGTIIGCVIVYQFVPRATAQSTPTLVKIPATPEAIATGLPCNLQRAAAGGQAFACPLGAIRNVVDFECGTYVPGDRNKLNCNLGAGAGRKHPTHNGHVVINPDNGICTIIEQGYIHPTKRIAIFCPRKSKPPIIRLYGQVIVTGSLKVRRPNR